MTTHRSNETRHHYFRLAEGEALPDALTSLLQEAGVATGWVRGHGVLEDVALRVYSPTAAGLGPLRRLQGTMHVVCMDGSVGLSGGAPSVSLRVVLSRETDGGNAETWSGELAYARVVGMEAHVTSAEDLALALAPDAKAGVAMLGDPSGAPPRRVEPARSPGPPAAWGDAMAASAAQPEPRPAHRPAPAPPASGAPMPVRPPSARREEAEDDAPYPEAGDVVEHFAFGRCDVLRSDGDRLHLKVHKDGRIREIALEMLKVTPLGETDGGHRRFKLDRKL